MFSILHRSQMLAEFLSEHPHWTLRFFDVLYVEASCGLCGSGSLRRMPAEFCLSPWKC